MLSWVQHYYEVENIISSYTITRSYLICHIVYLLLVYIILLVNFAEIANKIFISVPLRLIMFYYKSGTKPIQSRGSDTPGRYVRASPPHPPPLRQRTTTSSYPTHAHAVTLLWCGPPTQPTTVHFAKLTAVHTFFSGARERLRHTFLAASMRIRYIPIDAWLYTVCTRSFIAYGYSRNGIS